MAIQLSQVRKLNAVRIISRKDSAVDTDASDWDRYDEDPLRNGDALVMNADGKKSMEPTVFICNFDTSGREAAKIKNALISGVDDDKNAKITMGDWQYRVVQICLKGIENPPGTPDVIEFKKEGNGYVSDRTMDALEKIGLVAEIFGHYTTLTKEEEAVKENSKN